MAAKKNVKVSETPENTFNMEQRISGTPPDSIDYGLISTMSLENKEEWEKWRSLQPSYTVFGSAFPIWFGFGYQSLNEYTKVVRGQKAKEEPDMFTQRAMDHGKKNESRALNWFLDLLTENKTPDMKRAQLFSDLSSMVLEDRNGRRLMMTPDAMLLTTHMTETPYQTISVVEVKCPIRTASKFDSVEDWVTDFQQRYPLGYTAAFLQALLYSSADLNVTEFHTVFLFVHEATNMESIVVHTFEMTSEMRKFALSSASDFSDFLKSDAEKARVPSARKRTATDYQTNSHMKTWIGFPRFITYVDDSDEQDGDETGDQ